MGNTYGEYEGIVALMSLENCADGCRDIAVFSLFRHCSTLLYAAVFRRRSEPNQKLALAGCEIPLLTAAQTLLCGAIAPPRPWRASRGAIPACRCGPAGRLGCCASP